MTFLQPDHDADHQADLGRDRILVVGSPEHAVDLLRFATIRSDDVVFVAEQIDPTALRFARRFAIEIYERPFTDRDLERTAAVLVSLSDDEAENRIVRSARRHGIGVHVVGRPLVSDFTILALLQQHAVTDLAA